MYNTRGRTGLKVLALVPLFTCFCFPRDETMRKEACEPSRLSLGFAVAHTSSEDGGARLS